MEFSGEPLSNEQVRHALISVLLVDSAVVPIVVTFVLYHQEPLRWGYLVASVACLMVPLAYVTISLFLRREPRRVDPDPLMVFIGVSAGLVALAFIEVAAGFEIGFYKPVFVLGAMLVAIVGDRRIRVAIAVLCVGLVVWTSWAEGIDSGHFVTVVTIYAWVIVIAIG